jgi:hypothetical protein
MHTNTENRKKPYHSPTVTTLSLDEAKELVARVANRSDEEAKAWLMSLLPEPDRMK